MNLPNKITFFRILVMIPFIVFLFFGVPYKNYIILGIFLLLSFTDVLDGYFARKKKQVTHLGKTMDPIADKFLVITLLTYLTIIGFIDDWMAIIIIAREVLVTILRVAAMPKGIFIPVSILGKLKTFSQTVGIVAVLLNPKIGWYIMLIVVLLTLLSGIDYFLKARKLIKEFGNIPNTITFFRLLLIPFLAWALIHSQRTLSLILLAVIVAGDKLDGVSARIAKQVTKFGMVFDSFTDYTLMVTFMTLVTIKKYVGIEWPIIFLIPCIVIIIAKLYNYKKKKKYVFPVSLTGRITVGIVYAMFLSILIDFPYKNLLLVLSAIMVYITMAIYFGKAFYKKRASVLK